MTPSRVSVVAPASSANLGPGYDCLALALPLHLRLDVERRPGPLAVEIHGVGADELPRDATNLVVRTCLDALLDEPEAVPVTGDGFAFRMESAIPLSAGCGSSAAAIVCALAAASALRGDPVDRQALVRDAAHAEGHPDNAAACVLGGLTLGAGPEPVVRRFDLPAELGLVLVVPPERLATRARAVLPSEVSRADAVWNVQHAALLIAALTCGRLDDLPLALRDRLHEDARAGLAPTFANLRGRAAELGALGVTLSGAGPSVLVWCRRAEAYAVAARVRALVPHALRVEALEPDAAGVCVETA